MAHKVSNLHVAVLMCIHDTHGGYAAASAQAAQTAIWLRLTILSPLLPVVYADHEPSPAKNLRVLLARALVSLATLPAVRGGSCSPVAQAGSPVPDEWGAAQLNGLFERIAGLLQALGSESWPAWLQGNQVTCIPMSHRKLRL